MERFNVEKGITDQEIIDCLNELMNREEIVNRCCTRLNDIESKLSDIQGWRDPKNTMSRIDGLIATCGELERQIGKLQQEISALKSKPIEVPTIPVKTLKEINAKAETMEPKRRGRPKKVQ